MIISLPEFELLKNLNPQRFDEFLDIATNKSSIDLSQIFCESAKIESLRSSICENLLNEFEECENSRLITIIGESLKWQRYVGRIPKSTKIDLFKHAEIGNNALVDQQVYINSRTIKFGKKNEVDCAQFSKNGEYLVTGSSDGFIEIWDADSGKLRLDLHYQAADALMMHSDPILCLEFSRDGEFLVSGSQNGEVKVWKISTGKCVKKIRNCHSTGVSHVAFSPSGLEVLTCGSGATETTFKLHGLVSGRMLREYRGHQSQCMIASFCREDVNIVSGSSDGEIRLWNATTTECILRIAAAVNYSTTSPSRAGAVAVILPSVEQSTGLTGKPQESIIVVWQNFSIKQFTISGDLMFELNFYNQLADPSQSSQELKFEVISASLSSHGKYLYCACDNGVLICVDLLSKRVMKALQAHEALLKGVSHHPSRNMACTYGSDHTLKIWESE
jgi:WD40 repeat-containing protein SMU1